MGRTIPVMMAFDRGYLFPSCVAIHSVLEQADPADRYRFYILTAKENVEVAIDFDGRKVSADKFLKQVGLSEEEGCRLVGKLSGGQQQRVAIARAIASNSPIIVADEPTGNLDEETEEKIIDLFKSLAHESKKIVIIVTHSKQVASHADVVLRLRKGKMAQGGAGVH